MLGSRHISVGEVGSTNTHARALLKGGAKEGTVVTAEHQTEGRGRLDRQWVDAAGLSFLGSYILEPGRAPEEWGGLPLMAGLAVHNALTSLVPADLHLKWPNDILAGDKKICGILVESGKLGNNPWAIVGIGINLNQRSFEGEFRLPPTSLLLETGRMLPPGEVLSALSTELNALYTRWTESGNPVILEAWKKRSRMFNHEVDLQLEVGNVQRVTPLDLAPSGALIVRDKQGDEREVYAGDIAYT